MMDMMEMKVDRFYIENEIKTSEIYDRCSEGCYANSIIRVNTDSTKFNRELVKLLLPIVEDYYDGKLNMEEGIDEKIVHRIQDFINYWKI